MVVEKAGARMPFQITNPTAAKAAALKAARESAAPKADDAKIMKWINPEDCPERLRLIFDDSGSMSGQIENAKLGTTELIRNSIPNQTAVSIHFLETVDEKLSMLNSNLIEVAQQLKDKRLELGGTPMFETFMRVIALNPKATRYVAFSDGSPTDSILVVAEIREDIDRLRRWKLNADIIIAEVKKHKAPIDTVFFGPRYNEDEITLMKYIAESTGGYFLHFDPAKVNFAKAFKYLAGPQRLMLASESVRREIESGQRS
jgi:hypothetical protein